MSSSASAPGSLSASALDAVAAVRNLSTPVLGQRPDATNERPTGNSPHETLMSRLKSRPVRAEADSHKYFLNKYRRPEGSMQTSDSKLNDIIRRTAARVDELREYVDRLSIEDADLSRKVERMLAMPVRRVPDEELMHMSVVERQQRRIAEDKKEEALKRQCDEAQTAFVRVHRRLQNDLAEMRDYNVFLQECRQLRLEKIQESLGTESDGRRLRALVREMIRHGAQRVLQRLEQAAKWLEPWMREVLANSCHIEIRIEDAEKKFAALRRRALGPVSAEIQALSQQTKQERLDALCTRTWSDFTFAGGSAGLSRAASLAGTLDRPATSLAGERCGGLTANEGDLDRPATSPAALPSVTFQVPPVAGKVSPKPLALNATPGRVSEDISSRIQEAEADLAALRRLLSDMRQNAGAAVCFRVREADRASGKDHHGKEGAHAWGTMVLTVLVSEEFAKETLKAMEKASGGKKQLTD